MQEQMKKESPVLDCYLTSSHEILRTPYFSPKRSQAEQMIFERCWRLCKKQGYGVQGKVFCIYKDQEAVIAFMFVKKQNDRGQWQVDTQDLEECMDELNHFAKENKIQIRNIHELVNGFI